MASGTMVAGAAFVLFGLLGGLGYLAYMKERDLLAYGLAGLAVSSFLEGLRDLFSSADEGFLTALEVLRNVALGSGLAFLGYIGAIEGWRYYGVWRAKRKAAENAFKLRLEASKDATPSARASSGR